MLRVGSKVKVKSWEEILKETEPTLISSIRRKRNNNGWSYYNFIEEMRQFCEKETKISYFFKDGSKINPFRLEIDNGIFFWQEWMLKSNIRMELE